MAVELANALAHAHAAGVIHRDVKPENVIVEHVAPFIEGGDAVANSGRPPPSSGEQDARVVVKLTDFGIAKLLDAQGVTSTGQVLGSPAHMAPEQIEGGEVDARADVFGLGVLLYECMVGHLPFEGNNPAQVLRRVLEGSYPPAEDERATVGRAYSALLDRALAHDPKDRFADCVVMREALLKELRRLGVDAPKTELSTWFDGPDAYAEKHATRVIAALCREAGEERKRGDVLGAAADYNRALAYAPHDPALLKIVATMHRAEARAKLLKQGLKVLAATAAIAALAFGVTRAIKPKIGPEPTPSNGATAVTSEDPKVRPADSAVTPPASSLATAPSVPESSPTHDPPVAQVPPSAVTSPSAHPHVHPSASAAPHDVHRAISLFVRPPQGVTLSLDGAGAFPVPNGYTLNLNDTRAHTLAFECVNELCVAPEVRTIPEGEDSRSIEVELHIKDATLVVQGNPQNQFVLAERNQSLQPGLPVKVRMNAQSRITVTVNQLNPPASQRVTLTAGKQATVVFDP